MSSSYKDPIEPFWFDYWRGISATPRAWAKKGENLVRAFRLVAAASVEGDIHCDMRDQALMLAGMGIEVMLKALIVADAAKRELVVRKPTTKTEQKLQDTFYSHNLAKLAHRAGLSLSKQQPRVAKVLSEHIYWRGRYVMPKEQGIKDIIPIRHGKTDFGPRHRPVTDKQVEELIEHVVAEVHRRLQNKP